MDRTTQQMLAASDAHDISNNRYVSLNSRWNDDVWRLDNPTIGSAVRGTPIYWPDDVPFGLISDFKILFWTAMADPIGANAKSPFTLASMATGMRVLARWMFDRGYEDFSELGGNASIFFERHLSRLARIPSRAADAPEGVDADAASEQTAVSGPQEKSARISRGTVYSSAAVFILIYRQAEALARYGIAAMSQEPPFAGRSAYEIAAELVGNYDERIPPVPDEIALPVLNGLARMLDVIADDVIRLQDLYFSIAYRNGHRSLFLHPVNLALRAFQFSTIPGESAPWRHPPGQNGASPTKDLRDLIICMRDAGYLAVYAAGGLRPGEGIAITGGTEPETGLPTCIIRETSASGGLDLYRVVSTLKKGHVAPIEESWLIGSAPAGSDKLPLAVRGIAVVERLFAPWRVFAEQPEARRLLSLSFIGPGLPTGPDGIGPITLHRVARSVSSLYAKLMDPAGMPDYSRMGEDLREYRSSSLASIELKQWRKSFALFVMRTNSLLLPALQRQFKHLSMAVTEGAYVGRDVRLLEAFDEGRMQDTNRFLRERARGKTNSVGRLGRLIDDNLRAVDSMLEEGDLLSGLGPVEAMRTHGTGFWFSQHGNCGIGIAPHRAACHAIAGTPSFLHTRPNFELRSPQVCAGCELFVVGDANTPYWRRRGVTNARAAASARRAGNVQAAKSFQERADVAWSLLKGLKWNPKGERSWHV